MSRALTFTSEARPTAREPKEPRSCESGSQDISDVTYSKCGVCVVTTEEFVQMLIAETTDPAVCSMFIAMHSESGETLEAYVARVHPELSPIERDQMYWHLWMERDAITRGILRRCGKNATAVLVNP